MIINFSDQNCLTRYCWSALTSQTGTNGQNIHGHTDVFCLFCCFTSQSTAMVMSGRSVHLTKLFSWVSLNKRLTSTSCTYFHLQQTDVLINEKYVFVKANTSMF